MTAQRVAALRLLFERAPADFGDPGSDEALARDVAGSSQPDSGVPMARHLRARTAFFDRVVLAALDRGISQVVVAAAGYDGRSMRYALPGVRWFEVDHPDTQADKRARMVRLGLVAAATTYVPADFTRDDPGSLLVDTGFDRGRPALVLLERLAVYLEPAVLARLLRSLRAVAAPGSRLAISVSAALRDGSEQAAAEARERRARFAAAVTAVGEPARSVLPTRPRTCSAPRVGSRCPARCARKASRPSGSALRACSSPLQRRSRAREEGSCKSTRTPSVRPRSARAWSRRPTPVER